ncbi:MAG: hypothetical protein U1A27_00175 [Phycisphaerae bacterium]
MDARMRGIISGLAITIAAGWLPACTAPSNRMAADASARCDAVRAAVVERQHHSLLVLAYRDTLARLNAATTPAERAAILNEAWNDRDLFDFWCRQEVLARATHYATVDAYIAGQQGMLALLAKGAQRQFEGPLNAVENWAAARIGQAMAGTATSRPAGG